MAMIANNWKLWENSLLEFKSLEGSKIIFSHSWRGKVANAEMFKGQGEIL